MIAYFERFTLKMTKAQALAASQPGQDASAEVDKLMFCPEIIAQLNQIPNGDITAELREYGAWEPSELADDKANYRRIVWLAAGNIREELAQKGR